MNYNEYDSNGNKKRFNMTDLLNDKKQRSRLILAFYALIIIALIIVIRVNNSYTNENNQENTNKNESINKKEEIQDNIREETKEKFSFIDQNNYEFKFVAKYNKETSVIEGKRYNNKYQFTLTSNGNVYHFLGSQNYIKGRESEKDDYISTGFPYVYLNFFDNSLLKEIVDSSKINKNVYEISNEDLNKIINGEESSQIKQKESINTIELVTRNNKITGINIDYTNVLSDFSNEKITAKLSLEYSNFGLVEDFDINF